MTEQFDIRLDSLTGANASSPESVIALSTGAPADKTFYLETFGCQMNVHDSEKVAGVLLGRGYHQVETIDAARLVLYNTCSIREKAAQKIFSRLGAYRKYSGEEKIIGVLGCVAQQEGEEIFERSPWVRLVCGSASYSKLPDLIAELEAGNRRVMGLDKDTDATFETDITRRDNPFRAYLTIIEGCDKACSYCVVPFTRGPERSRASASVLEEVRRLADAGYSEIQLLGQTVNSYRDPSSKRKTFAELLVAVAGVPGIRRVRFTTSHPRDFGRDIVEAIDAVPELCDHVHLPVQSGSTRVLQSMQRLYTRDEYMRRIDWMKRARRQISITTDIIVGFPGETERELEETLSLIELVGYDSAFTFKYSPRPNTPALALEDAIPDIEKARRLAVVNEKQRAVSTHRNKRHLGQTLEVMVEGKNEARGQWIGRTSQIKVMNFTVPAGVELKTGSYVDVLVTNCFSNSLVGEMVTAI